MREPRPRGCGCWPTARVRRLGRASPGAGGLEATDLGGRLGFGAGVGEGLAAVVGERAQVAQLPRLWPVGAGLGSGVGAGHAGAQARRVRTHAPPAPRNAVEWACPSGRRRCGGLRPLRQHPWQAQSRPVHPSAVMGANRADARYAVLATTAAYSPSAQGRCRRRAGGRAGPRARQSARTHPGQRARTRP